SQGLPARYLRARPRRGNHHPRRVLTKCDPSFAFFLSHFTVVEAGILFHHPGQACTKYRTSARRFPTALNDPHLAAATLRHLLRERQPNPASANLFSRHHFFALLGFFHVGFMRKRIFSWGNTR